MRKIETIKKVSTLEAATTAIRNYVIDNKLQIGDLLPTEMELTRALGISRSIVREAMQHYRTLGVISAKTRAGAVIRQLIPTDPFRDYLPFISADPMAFRELAESRLCLETGAVSLLVRKAKPRHIAELKEICRKMKNADIALINQLDMEFHRTLLGIPENRLLNSFLPLLVNFFQDQQPEKLKTAEPGAGREYTEHMDMVKALAERNPDKLRKLLEVHLQAYITSE
jgi:DNA-binding FadR family transcriptional regulator